MSIFEVSNYQDEVSDILEKLLKSCHYYYWNIPALLWSEKEGRFALVAFTDDFWHKIQNFMKTKIQNEEENTKNLNLTQAKIFLQAKIFHLG